MDKQTGIAALVATATGLVSAGAFKFYEFILKQRREVAKEDKDDQTLYRDDLIKRVEKLEKNSEEDTSQILDLTREVVKMQVEIKYLRRDNETLRIHLDSLRQGM